MNEQGLTQGHAHPCAALVLLLQPWCQHIFIDNSQEAKRRQAACVISPAAGWQPPAESQHAHTEAAASSATAGDSSTAIPQISTHGGVWRTQNATEAPAAALADCHVLHHPRWLKGVQQRVHAKMAYNYGSRLCLLHFVFAISPRLFLCEKTATCLGVYCWIVSVEGERLDRLEIKMLHMVLVFHRRAWANGENIHDLYIH